MVTTFHFEFCALGIWSRSESNLGDITIPLISHSGSWLSQFITLFFSPLTTVFWLSSWTCLHLLCGINEVRIICDTCATTWSNWNDLSTIEIELLWPNHPWNFKDKDWIKLSCRAEKLVRMCIKLSSNLTTLAYLVRLNICLSILGKNTNMFFTTTEIHQLLFQHFIIDTSTVRA